MAKKTSAQLDPMPSIDLHLDTADLARDYERLSVDRQFKSGQRLVTRLRVAQGEHVLDVGSGTGLLTQHVAGIVGSEGLTIGIDPLPLRVELARQKTGPNLHFEVGHANDLTKFAPDSFDVVYLNAVFHWVQEKRGALRQFFRVLKSGGRLGITTRSKEIPSELHQIKAKVLSQRPYADYPESSNGQPEWISASEMANLLGETGFTVEAVTVRPNHHFHPSAEDVIQFSSASSFGNYLGHLPAELRQCAHDEICAEFEKLRTPEGIRLDGAGLVAIAVKP